MNANFSDVSLMIVLCDEILQAGGDPTALRRLIDSMRGVGTPGQWTEFERFGLLFCLVLLNALMTANASRGRQWLFDTRFASRSALLHALWREVSASAPQTAHTYQPWWTTLQERLVMMT